MKIFKTFILAVTLLFALSCSTMGLQSKINRVSVGMTKKEVVRTMGNSYETVHSMLTQQGEVVEIIQYTDGLYGTVYELEFYNDLLVRYTKVADPSAERDSHDHNRRHRH